MKQHLHCISFTTGVYNNLVSFLTQCFTETSYAVGPYNLYSIDYSFPITYMSYLLHMGQMIFTEPDILI